jgi:hypothetical protein
MADPSGQQPPGGSMGHQNMRPGASGQQYIHQGGQPSQHMMRPQVQQYMNRPSPSYQQQPNPPQMQVQFQRPPYQHPMQGGSQMAVGSPHSVNIGHKQQPHPNAPHPSMINQHTNLSQFNTMGQGSPLNPQLLNSQQLNSQQLNPQAAGSPYQMVQGSPAGVLPRYNSPQMQNPQMSSQPMQSQQQIPSQQMPQQQYSQQQQQQHQQNMQQRYQLQQQQQQQMQSQQLPQQQYAQQQQQQHPKAQQHPSLSQQIPSPYQKPVQSQNQYSMQPTTPNQQSFAPQQQTPQQQPQQYPSQNSQQMHQSQQPMYQQKSPQVSLQYQQSPQSLQQPLSQPPQFAIPAPPQQSQPQTSYSSSQSMLQQPSPIKQPLSNQPKVPTEMPKATSLSLPSSSGTTNAKSPAKILANKAINRRPAVPRIRRNNPAKNLLMKPKASVLKHKKDEEGNVRKGVPKRVRWAPTLRVRHPQKFIRKRLKSRYLSPLSPPIMISGNEAKIATRLMQPIYYGELVVEKKTRKGLPPVRARLIGGKIVKPYTKFLSVMYAPKRQKPSRSALRRMANERSFTINREIECGERPPFYNANSNLSQIPSSQPSLPNISLTESSSKEITKKPLITSIKQPLQSRINYSRRENLPLRRTFFPFSIKPQILKETETEKPKSPELSEEEKKERLETIKILNNIPWRTLPKKSKSPILPRIWHPPIKINKDWIVLPKSHSLCHPIPIWHPPLLWPPKTLITKRKKIFKIDGKVNFFLHPKSNERIIQNNADMEIDDDDDNDVIQKRIRFSTPLINNIIDANQETDLTKTVFDPLSNPSKSVLSSKHYIDPQPFEDEEEEVEERKNSSKRKKKNKNKKSKNKNKKREKSPPLVKRRYENPAFRVPSLRPPPPPTQEPSEPNIPIDLTKNPLK